MEGFLNGLGNAGGKLKEVGITHLASPNTGATNESSFTALPGAYRSDGGGFDDISYFGMWWTSSQYNTSWAWYRGANYDDSKLTSMYDLKKIGFSVRCVKDY